MPSTTRRQTSEPTPNSAHVRKGSPAETIRESLLLERCKSGDSAAWNRLIRHHHKTVYNFAYALCRNVEEADDIVGQVFLRLYQNIHSFRQESRFSSWLFRIVQNTYFDLYIRPAHAATLSLELAVKDVHLHNRLAADRVVPSPERICLDRETSRLLATAVNFLPDHQRQVIQMYHAEGKTYEEIASRTGLSVGTVKSRLNRARHTLRERLDDQREALLLE